MTTALPPSSDFSGASTDKGTFKAWGNSVRSFLSDLLGTDGEKATALATLGAPISGYVAKSSAYSVVAGDKGKIFDCTGTWTMGALAAASAGDGFNFAIKNSGSGVIIFDPNLSETIDGAATLAVNSGESLFLYGNGTSWVGVCKAASSPSGAGMDYWGATLPSGWLWADGSAISRTTYASLFAAIGTTHGVGDGSTTFNLPDKRDRVSIGKGNMGGSAANRITVAGGGWDTTVLGSSGGVQNVTLTAAESGLRDHSHGTSSFVTPSGGSWALVAGNEFSPANSSATSGTGASGSSAASSAHTNLQPGVVCNYIIKT